MKISFLLVSLAVSANGFTLPTARSRVVGVSTADTQAVRTPSVLAFTTNDSDDVGRVSAPVGSKIPLGTAATAAFWALTASDAFAAGPDWGLFEGKTGSLLHPVMMGSLLVFSLSTALLGLQWKRQRTLGDEISALKKSLPDLGGASSVAEALATAKSTEGQDSTVIANLQGALSVETQIKELQAERKELAAKKPRDKHFSQGAWLAFLGTCFAIEGPLNTYARAGKLFPGPHLYAGAGLVCLWALAFACVPAMQKGDELARKVHIGANIAGIGMFGWQVVSGVPILLKVWEKTQWP